MNEGRRKPEHWGIVGGGLLGMTLAHRLAGPDRRVTVMEGAQQLGGLASAWSLGDVVWDRHYHVILLSDLRLRQVLTELGLEKDLQWEETRTGVYADGRLHSVSNAVEFMRFPALRTLDKLRLATTIVRASRIRSWRKLERIPVADWLRRWSGKRTFEKFWLPLLRAKLGDNCELASAAFIWAIIGRLYAARRSGMKKEMFGYLPGGYARILERFGDVLRDEGVEIRLGARVESVSPRDRGIEIDLGLGVRERFDQVIVTTAAPVAEKLCQGLGEDERERLRGIRYQGIICASLLSKQPLSPFYVTNITNITDTAAPFTGVIEMTALVDRKHFGGRSLIYLPRYLDPEDAAFARSDSELEEEFLRGLEAMYAHFRRDDVTSFRISRVRNVLAIPTLNYSERLPPMHTSVPGLHVINSAQILNGTLNVDETVGLAEDAAVALLRRPRGGPWLTERRDP